jgi:ADP-ribosylglycohydrolase
MNSDVEHSLLDKILGAFCGQALGDALGMPSELWPRKRVQGHFGWIDDFLDGPEENNAARYFRAGEVTDDTSMALAIADAIIELDGDIEAECIARHILQWVDQFDAFSKNVLGPTSKVAMTAIKKGTAVSELTNLGVTNGAAMRTMPLGCLIPRHSIDDFYAAIREAASPTHKSDVSVAGAVAVAWAISSAIDGETWKTIASELPNISRFAQNQISNTFSPCLGSRIELALNVVAGATDIESASEDIYNIVGAGTGTIESVPAAIAMVELAKCDPNYCAILCANLGGDTDTIGAMATAICGAIRGISGINEESIETLNRVNNIDFSRYAQLFVEFRRSREIAIVSS